MLLVAQIPLYERIATYVTNILLRFFVIVKYLPSVMQ